jgi:nucleotide-binding universal stress UspA family protein
MSQPHPVGANDEGRSGRVVVGVDGSETSIRALQWAAREAHWMGATLEVVTARTFPEGPDSSAPVGAENVIRNHRPGLSLARPC